MAILPPTSPTTVMGGFSLAIITAKESRTGYLGEHVEEGCVCYISLNQKQNLSSRLGKMGWENFISDVEELAPQMNGLELDHIKKLAKVKKE